MGYDGILVAGIHGADCHGPGLVYWYVHDYVRFANPGCKGHALTSGWVLTVCYTLGIYLLNLFLAFLTPKFDPSLEQDDEMEGGQSALPTKQDEEFRPFIRRLPEFKFWHNATRAIALSIFATLFNACDIPGTCG